MTPRQIFHLNMLETLHVFDAFATTKNRSSPEFVTSEIPRSGTGSSVLSLRASVELPGQAFGKLWGLQGMKIGDLGIWDLGIT